MNAIVSGLVVVFSMCNLVDGREQCVGASGRLLCHGMPAIGVSVILWDYDMPFKDDLMAMTMTDTHGAFTLAGSTDEYTIIEPHLAIYKKCWNANACFPDIVIEVPEEFITDGKIPWRYYQLDREICDT
ncbi:Transthyretin-like protein 2 [Toxocara canis]|uniref:Transthyretin-like protein 2 n=2 Tax=Toxocara canis TaxID=6265 RepID=A0A0B2W5L3_TOXCA|nr:Transthyretin-like protein 2 [Toxocara canis]VDM38614.1 unnamed protein product [Toxocara canis]